MEKERIVATHFGQLKKQIMGRKDCTIYITYNCAREINHLSILDYDEFMEDLKARNIELKDEVENIGKE